MWYLKGDIVKIFLALLTLKVNKNQSMKEERRGFLQNMKSLAKGLRIYNHNGWFLRNL